MEIRYLVPGDDLFALSRVYELSWKHAYKGIVPQAYLDSIPEGRWAGSVTREGMRSLLLTDNGTVAGTCGFCKSRWTQHPDSGEIVSLYLIPEYMGRGFGTRLLERAISELRQSGFEEIILWVLEDNHRARRFYERNGFTCTEEYMEDSIGGKPLREVLYKRSLRGSPFTIRPMTEEEYPLLADFLYEAIFIPEGVEPPPKDIIEKPELQVYIKDFGKQRGDFALAAVCDSRIVGAVWTRIMNDYGHIDDDTPSFAISIYKEHRGQGIGTALMLGMLSTLRNAGFKSASLAVQKENYAVKMYRRVGFETVDENDEEYIMVCRL